MTGSLLQSLRCVHTSSRLKSVEPQFCAQLNARIADERVFDALGRKIERSVDGLLVNEDASYGYPIFDEVPHLLRDEAIVLEGVM
ncbi:MAG: hypothetical protein CMJ77_15090 [Planctomycetaceae bacterium]|nr:hypothetical protein [Planctomycetaceae bacterium]